VVLIPPPLLAPRIDTVTGIERRTAIAIGNAPTESGPTENGLIGNAPIGRYAVVRTDPRCLADLEKGWLKTRRISRVPHRRPKPPLINR
jgi:hypothetical protein